MNPTAVISCPTCLRQYEIEPSAESVLVQCGICKATFKLIVPTLTGPAEGVMVLNCEVPVIYSFINEACETLARHTCTVMRAEGQQITPRSFVNTIKRMASDRVCGALAASDPAHLKFDREPGSPEERRAMEAAISYFCLQIAPKSRHFRRMLTDIFVGVLSGIDWRIFNVTEPVTMHCPACRKDFEAEPGSKPRCPECKTVIEPQEEAP